MTELAYVSLEKECTEADRAAVAEVFDAAGIPADVGGSIIRLSAAHLAWIVAIGLPGLAAWTFFKAALLGAGDEAGRDGWRALMSLVKGIHEKRSAVSQAPEGEVSITTADPSVEIALPSDFRMLLTVAYTRSRNHGQRCPGS